MNLHELTVSKIEAAFPDAIESVKDFRGERTIRVRRERLVEVCRLLRDDPGLRYNYLSDLSATDYFPDEPRFCVNYHMLSMPHNNARVRLSVYVSGEDAVVPSVTGVWPSNWPEREAYDMFAGSQPSRPAPISCRRMDRPPQRRDRWAAERAVRTASTDPGLKPRPEPFEVA
jgi:NADH-quinone oxidoreductase subunit C